MSDKENEIQVIEITEELLREKLYEVRGQKSDVRLRPCKDIWIYYKSFESAGEK
jgi:hypothetical protein